MKNFYVPIEGKIVEVIDESPTIKTFVVKTKEQFNFATGQFAEVTVPGLGEAPFTPSSSPYNTETIDLTIMKAGRVTARMHEMKAGNTLGIRGPYGKGYPLDKIYGKEVLMVAGGVGMAPLRSFLLSLLEEANRFKRIVLCYGARTPSDIIYKGQFGKWMKNDAMEVYRSVDHADKTWKETEGVVPVLLDKVKMDLKNSVAVVCGPPIMMRFATLKLFEVGYRAADIYLSMEKNMSCGLGKCGHCMLGTFYACKDGPVFTYDQIEDVQEIWD